MRPLARDLPPRPAPMSSAFDLVIATDPSIRTAELRLLDSSGVQLAYRKTDFRSIEVSRQRAMFDLRNYLHELVDPGDEETEVAKIGVTIAEKVLGEEIFRLLWASTSQRTLRVRL